MGDNANYIDDFYTYYRKEIEPLVKKEEARTKSFNSAAIGVGIVFFGCMIFFAYAIKSFIPVVLGALILFFVYSKIRVSINEVFKSSVMTAIVRFAGKGFVYRPTNAYGVNFLRHAGFYSAGFNYKYSYADFIYSHSATADLLIASADVKKLNAANYTFIFFSILILFFTVLLSLFVVNSFEFFVNKIAEEKFQASLLLKGGAVWIAVVVGVWLIYKSSDMLTKFRGAKQIFRGLVFRINLRKSFSFKTYIVPKGASETIKGFFLKFAHGHLTKIWADDSDVKTGFDIYSNNEDEAKSVLKPEIFRCLELIDKKFGPNFSFSFAGTHLYITIETQEDFYAKALIGGYTFEDTAELYLYIRELLDGTKDLAV